MSLRSPLLRFLDRLLRRVARVPGLRAPATWLDGVMTRNASIELQCGLTVKGDLRIRDWRRMAGRGFHELETERFITDYLRPGDCVIDVGAHIGMLSTIAAKLVAPGGTVYAFEVDPHNHRELLRTIGRNRLDNVAPQAIGLGNRSGTFRFIRPQGAWGSFIDISDSRGSSEQQLSIPVGFELEGASLAELPVTTMDQFCVSHRLERIDLVKIDVDGPELSVLEGAGASLRKYRPALIVEVSPCNYRHGDSFEAIRGVLDEAGYTLYAGERTVGDLRQVVTTADLPVSPADEYAPGVNLLCRPPGADTERWRSLLC